jgi:hypothetical protein
MHLLYVKPLSLGKLQSANNLDCHWISFLLPTQLVAHLQETDVVAHLRWCHHISSRVSEMVFKKS